MKTLTPGTAKSMRMLMLAGAVSLAVIGCASAPQVPAGAAQVRAKLEALESNVALADNAPVEIREARTAVLAAEAPIGTDVELGVHRVYMADQLVEIASAKATARYAEDQRAILVRERDEARLNARTNEADRARRESLAAQDRIYSTQASAARSAAAADRNAAESARNAAELRRQIDTLEAEATDRGLVLTLGDVLFATGRSDLTAGGNKTLDKLVAFLDQYPERSAAIEGHTDDVGSLDMNQGLSQRRAESVKSYLMQKGIQPLRLSASGMGETQPIAENSSDSGRQQNRRVEIIINNPPAPGAVATK